MSATTGKEATPWSAAYGPARDADHPGLPVEVLQIGPGTREPDLGMAVLGEMVLGEGWNIPAIPVLGSPSRTRISRIPGRDATVFTITSDEDYQEYQLRAVPVASSPVTAGVRLEPGTDLTGITDIDIIGHSLAYAFGADVPGPGGTGWATQVAEALGLDENMTAASGSQLVPGGTYFNGVGPTMLAHPRTGTASPYNKLGRLAVIWFGANDMSMHGLDGVPILKHAFRALVSRMRASIVYEDNDLTRHAYSGFSVGAPPAGTASGANIRYCTANGSTVTITLAAGRVPEGGAVTVGFMYHVDYEARWTITLDGVAQGEVDLRDIIPAAYEPSGFPENYLHACFRMEGLTDDAHTIVLTANNITGYAFYDYCSVEPAEAQPVVLLTHNHLTADPGYSAWGAFPFPLSDVLMDAINTVINEVAAEYDARVQVVDMEPIIALNRSFFSDGSHFNQAGNDAIAVGVLSAIAATKAAVGPVSGASFIDTIAAKASRRRHFRLGEPSGTSAVDAEGNGNGTYVGTPGLGAASLVTGDSDPSVDLSGAGQYVTIPASGNDPTNNSKQACSWGVVINPPSVAGDYYIYTQDNGAGAIGVSIQINAGVMYFFVYEAGTFEQRICSALITTGRHLIVGTWDGTRVRLYIDGVLAGSDAAQGAMDIYHGTSHVLGAGPGGTYPFPGKLDELFLLAEVLSPTEIEDLASMVLNGPEASSGEEALSPGEGGYAGEARTVILTDDELVSAVGIEGNYVIKAFVQDLDGEWSE